VFKGFIGWGTRHRPLTMVMCSPPLWIGSYVAGHNKYILNMSNVTARSCAVGDHELYNAFHQDNAHPVGIVVTTICDATYT
jgi:hypothetical protein